MLVRAVVHDKVKDDFDVAFFCLGHQPIEVCQGAILGIDVAIVGDVISEIHLRRRETGRDPDGVNSQSGKVIQMPGDAVQIAGAVVVESP